MWLGPAAIWPSGGVRRFMYGPFVPKCRPSKETTGTGPAGMGDADRVPAGRIARSAGATLETVFDDKMTGASACNVDRRGSSREDRAAGTEFNREAAIANPTTKTTAARRHGWGYAMHVERCRDSA